MCSHLLNPYFYLRMYSHPIIIPTSSLHSYFLALIPYCFSLYPYSIALIPYFLAHYSYFPYINPLNLSTPLTRVHALSYHAHSTSSPILPLSCTYIFHLTHHLLFYVISCVYLPNLCAYPSPCSLFSACILSLMLYSSLLIFQLISPSYAHVSSYSSTCVHAFCLSCAFHHPTPSIFIPCSYFGSCTLI